jgi:hypothetical protein
MAHSVLRKIANSVIANRFYTIIVDEATDVSFKEQVSVCLRHISQDTLQAHEDFVGVYKTGSTTAETLTKIICRLGLDLNNCRGQAYDGASNMSGRLSGVQARISADFPKAVYIHCFCHSPSLAVQDSLRNILLISQTLDIIQELSNVVKYSSKCNALLETIKQDLDCNIATLKPLCPTRWTVKAKSFESVLLNYEPLLELLHSIMTRSNSGTSTFEVLSKASGIHSRLDTFDILFGIMLGEKFFSITDALSLQGESVTASDAKLASTAVCNTIERLRSDTEFSLFWDSAISRACELQLPEPRLPRTRRPRRYDAGSVPGIFSSPNEYYQKICYEFADNINGHIKKRFNQENYTLYLKAELLLKAAGIGTKYFLRI